MVGTVDILICVGADIVMDFVFRIIGRTTQERDAKVELAAGRENEVYRGNNKHL